MQKNELFQKIFEDYLPNWEEIMKFLEEKGYFSAPASTKFHGNYEGGLFEHSMNVTLSLAEMTQKLDLKWEKERSPFVVGMFHDLCKMDEYKWSVEDSAYHHVDTLLTGHGEKSIIIASQFMTLTEEEIACIRYHMGAFYQADIPTYSKAVNRYPNVLWTHTADMVASQIKGV